MENNTEANKTIGNLLNDFEGIVSDFSKELTGGLEQRSITIDNIEMLMLKVMTNVKSKLVETTEELINESTSKKKETLYCKKCNKKNVVTFQT